MFELWFTPGLHFRTLLAPLGVIWNTRSFPGQLWAHLLGCSEPQGPKCMQKVVSQPQRCHFRGPILVPFLYLFQKKRVRGECWLAGRFFCSFSWFSGSLDLQSAAACAVQSQFFMFGVTLENVSFLYTFWCFLESFGHICSCFWCSFSELEFWWKIWAAETAGAGYDDSHKVRQYGSGW